MKSAAVMSISDESLTDVMISTMCAMVQLQFYIWEKLSGYFLGTCSQLNIYSGKFLIAEGQISKRVIFTVILCREKNKSSTMQAVFESTLISLI